MRVAVKIELSEGGPAAAGAVVAVAERGDASAGAVADRADGRGWHDEQGDRREAGHGPEQGRALEAAIRGPRGSTELRRSVRGVATTVGRTRWPRRR